MAHEPIPILIAVKIIMGSYACEPGKGSEPGVGWNWAVQAAILGHEVHVVTRANNRTVIENELLKMTIPRLHFHYYDLPRPLISLKKRTGYYGMLAYYYLWQLGAFRLARRLHRNHNFDLAHHVTFVNDWMPSGVGWIGVPFIWGPVGGSTNVVPPSIRPFIPAQWRRYEWIRRFVQRTFRSVDPLVRLTRRRADLILTYTAEAIEGIPKKCRDKARPTVHVGVSESDMPDSMPPRDNTDLYTVVSGSRLVHWKGFDLLVLGFSRFLQQGGSGRLLISGDGPFRPHLENLARSLEIGHCVRFLGHLPTRADVYGVLCSGDLYALPTLRDGPPVAILEAMLAARPILCLDIGATHEMVPQGLGFKIPVQTRDQVIEDIAQALVWSAKHRTELAEMGDASRRFVLEMHSWDRIGAQIQSIYREVGPSIEGIS